MLKDIASRQTVSPKYLDHILSSLRKAGLIKNTRGKGGGYSLTRPASDITLMEIISAVEGSLAPVECVDNQETCNRTHTCATRDLWTRLKEAVEDVLEKTTLESLIEDQNKKDPLPVDFSI
jgi:Rrf2 family transcriptional regulator, cysteine metabolism repressor